jgi:hypothetical protein
VVDVVDHGGDALGDFVRNETYEGLPIVKPQPLVAG